MPRASGIFAVMLSVTPTRTWLDSVGTPVGVQKKLMRHADVRTTMNIYGDAVTPDMREAHGKMVGPCAEWHGNGTDGELSH